MSLWPEDDEHLVSFHLRSGLDLADVDQVLLELLQNPRTQFAMRHLAPAKPDGRFNFVALLQPLARMLHAVIVIMVVSAGAKLNFLNRDRDLLLLRLVCLLLGFVLVLAEVDDAANGRIG